MVYILFILGLVLIIKASDYFIDSAVWIARATHIPDIIVGATIVSLCTTLPEAVVSSTSSAKGLPDMAFGNAFGSIVFNTAFILGITFLIVKPLINGRSSFLKNATLLFFLTIAVGTVVIIKGVISNIMGIVLLIMLIAYLLLNVLQAKSGTKDNTPSEKVDTSKRSVIKNISFLLIGAAGVVIGSNLLVDSGEKIAKMLGVSDLIIGLTITALGTSLPELVTAIVSMAKGVHSMSVGNIIGADILNILLVMGLSATICPIKTTNPNSAIFSIASVLIISAVVICFGLFNKKRFTRANGVLLLALYAAYIVTNILYFA